MKFKSVGRKDAEHLESIVGPDRFSMGQSNLELHSKDQSYHPAVLPEAVIWPVNRTEVSEILRYANEQLVPVTGWGSGTSVEGNPIPVQRGLVLDFSMMNRIVEIRDADFQADVEPGVVYQDLNEKLRHRGLFFAPDPGARATIGGMLANNASGIRTVRYGSTRANTLRLTVVLASGEIIDMGSRSSKTSSGYDLINLFIGSEGTLGLVVQATVRLKGLCEEISAAIATFSDVEAAAGAVFEIKRSGIDPASLELLAQECVALMNKERGLGLAVLPTLFIEFHGAGKNQLQESVDMAREICQSCGCDHFMSGIERPARDNILRARYEMAETIMRNHPGCSHTVIDVAVPVSAYPELISLAREEALKSGIPGYVFGHAGDGNLHLILMGKTLDHAQRAIIDNVSNRLVIKAIQVGGTSTGEHGTGIGKRKFMETEHGASLEWMKKIKTLFDPNGILNPGKILP
ncbi:Glycolate oxidase [uncultured Desulfobacterium sp.]|uniref:D-lactate dehydrogenase (cytochrome) n=1 Tax=uncultured Desulfobacterium sp. TaxID=201089 RepID=A0A445N2L8_9BACT|nr:Glycolate oxidase [uncultured Desulfobacterium sp.]